MNLGWFPSGDAITKVLILVYLILAIRFAFEGQWPRMTYWIGATLIVGSTLWIR